MSSELPSSPAESGALRLRSPSRLPLALPRALLVAVAVAGAYGNTLDVPLVFDDSHLLERAELHATSLAPSQLLRAAAAFPHGRWLAYVTFAADHAIHGLRPLGYHVVNLAIHAAASLLVMLLAARLLARLGLGDEERRRDAAAIAALLFALHPIQTMAVTYVIQRMTSLGTLFAVAALLSWLRARAHGALRPIPAVAAVLLWFLSYSCKENFAALPVIVLVIELCAGLELRAIVTRRPALSGAIALLLVAGATLVLLAYLPVIQGEQRGEYSTPIGARLLTQPRVLWHYLSLLALPLPGRLHVDYAWQPSSGPLSPPTTLPALAGLLALAAGAFALRLRWPLLTLSVGWFLGALLVEQTVLPIDFVFEHRLYFAAIGLFVAAGWLLTAFRPATTAGRWALALPLALLLGLATRARNEVWRDPSRLFADASAVGVGRARALINGAVAAKQQGRLDDAERMFLEATRLEPAAPQPWANLGNIASQRGHAADAERWYREALARDPSNAEVLYNLGVLFSARGRVQEAIDAYRRAIAAAPGHSDARVNLAILVAERLNDRAQAIAMLDEALAVDPGSPSALMNRALFLADAGRIEPALVDARGALRLLPDEANPHFVLAYVLRAAGRTDEARNEAEVALRLAPDHAEARALLAAPAPTGSRR